MSQAKVDKYKEYKKNRKQIIAKQKRHKKLAEIAFTGIITIASLALVFMIGFMIYGRYHTVVPDYDFKSETFVLGNYAEVAAATTPEEVPEDVPETE
ncbi:MAG: hypothetical protein IK125_09790, partial [Lachnospiraceae bacterium]|nr:hypothetical protein [Lachnospiraceae bacterium]